MSGRKERSAIIVTSSIAGTTPMPSSLAYSSAKTFVTFLAQGLFYELKNKIDVMSYAPGFV